MLLDTGSEVLTECTPDLCWSSGCRINSKQVTNGNFRGKNLTGVLLQKIRRQLSDDDHVFTTVARSPQGIYRRMEVIDVKPAAETAKSNLNVIIDLKTKHNNG